MKILMIGNSATYVNDIPKLLEKLISENGTEATVDSVTKGGRKLYENLAEGDQYGERIKQLVAENKYDVLFLQEQTCLPLWDRKGFSDSVSKLMDIVKAEKTVLYATPPRKEGAKFLKQSTLTVYGMTRGIINAYKFAARKNKATLSPVTMCFYNVMTSHPELELHAPDRAHCSYVGSCIATLSHYKAIFGVLPESCASLGIDADTLAIIKEGVSATKA